MGSPRHAARLAIVLLALLAEPCVATTVRWDAGFPGFRPGDVWFVSTVEFADPSRQRRPTLFCYSPADDVVSDVLRLSPPTGSPTLYLAFDPAGRGLWVADVESVRLLTPDGRLVHVADTVSTTLDVAGAIDGTPYTAESRSIRRYRDGVPTLVAELGSSIRGLAVVASGFAAGVSTRSAGDPNLLRLSPSGEVLRADHAGLGEPGGAGLVRALPDGRLVVVTHQRTTVSLVGTDGMSTTIADGGDGIFQADGLAVGDGDTVWVTSRGRPSSLQAFRLDGTRVHRVPLELDELGHPDDEGFFSPSGAACVPRLRVTRDAPPERGRRDERRRPQ